MTLLSVAEVARGGVTRALREYKRPVVGKSEGSRHENMKELIAPMNDIRILFAFDPVRTAILLIGGRKTGAWNTWYRRMIPLADALYDDHLRLLQEKGKMPQ